MLDKREYVFYLSYAGLVAALSIIYLKVKSTEGLTITTKEFKLFQSTFLSAYGLMILGEVRIFFLNYLFQKFMFIVFIIFIL